MNSEQLLGIHCHLITKGTTPTTIGGKFTDSGIPFVRAQNIANGSVSFAEDALYIDEQTHNLQKRSVIKSGDVLIAIAGTIGRVGVVPDNFGEMNCNQAVAIIRVKDTIDNNFLKHWLQSNAAVAQIKSSTVVGVISNLSLSQISNLKIKLPPLAQQQRIAAILDKAAEIKAKREQAIAKLDELAQSTFVEMFGDPRNNERKFPLNKIGELVSEFRGGAALKPEDFVEAGFPILHKGAIKQNGNVIIDEGKKTFATHEYAASKSANIIDREYLAVTLRDLVPTGPSIGLVASMEDGAYDEYLLAQGAYGFKIDKAKLNAEYFIQLSNMPNFRHVLRQFAVGSTQIHIRTPVYQDISIPVPPISLQNKFGELMRKQRLIRNGVINGLEKYSNLINSLQHQAFTAGFNA